MKYLIFIFLIISTQIFADSKQMKVPSNTGIIESMNLEAQSVYIHGKEYTFASDILIRDKNNNAISLYGLNPGQVIQFTADNKQSVKTYRQDKVDSQKITTIKILSDNRIEDEAH
jgi:hypothetical protein